MRQPRIPMSPDQLPKQRIVAVANLGARPDPFHSVVGWDEKPAGVKLPHGPQKAEYLGEVEWAWSPMNNRIDAYYISKGRTHWMLWLYGFDDNEGSWSWLAVGHVPRKEASRKQAAIHLLADFWRMDKEDNGVDHYHWIADDGMLDVSEWRTIALLVWPEVARRRIEEEDQTDDES